MSFPGKIQVEVVDSTDKVKVIHIPLGVLSLQEIWHYEIATSLLTFQLGYTIQQFQSPALSALQGMAEAYLVSFSEDAILCAIHVKCISIMIKDM